MQVIRQKKLCVQGEVKIVFFFFLSRENIISFVPGLNSCRSAELDRDKGHLQNYMGVSDSHTLVEKSSILDAGEEWIVILSLRILRAIKRT